MVLDVTYTYKREIDTDSSTPTSLPLGVQVAGPPSVHESSKNPDDPGNDWDTRISTILAATLYVVFLSLVIFGYITAGAVTGGPSIISSSSTALLLRNVYLPLAHIIIDPIGIFGVVLLSLTIEANLSKAICCHQWNLHLVNILLFAFSTLFSWTEWEEDSEFEEHPTESILRISTWSFLIAAVAF